MAVVEPAIGNQRETPFRDLHERITALTDPRSDRLFVSVGKPERGVVVVGLDGALDSATSATLTRVIERKMTCRASVIVDLSRLKSIDSAGIECLLAFDRGLRALGAIMLLAAPTGRVARVLDRMNMNEHVVVASSMASALNSIDIGIRAFAPRGERLLPDGRSS